MPPITRCPDIVVARAGGLVIVGKRWRRLIDLNRLLVLCVDRIIMGIVGLQWMRRLNSQIRSLWSGLSTAVLVLVLLLRGGRQRRWVLWIGGCSLRILRYR